MEAVEHLLSVKNALGEGPIWDSRSQSLVWVDIAAARIWQYSPRIEKIQQFDPGESITALAMRRSGGWVGTTHKEFVFLDLEHSRMQKIAAVEAARPDARFNDGAVDRQGRFWAGTLREEAGEDSGLYRLDSDLSVHRMVSDLTISNGIGWSPDNRTMYLADSRRFQIRAYDFEPDGGTLSNQRILIDSSQSKSVPDGLTVDSEGFIWSACWRGAKICRYAPDGSLDRCYPLPVTYPTSLIFGGENLDELYITTGNLWLSAAEREHQPLAGDIFRLRPGVRGMEEPAFAG